MISESEKPIMRNKKELEDLQDFMASTFDERKESFTFQPIAVTQISY